MLLKNKGVENAKLNNILLIVYICQKLNQPFVFTDGKMEKLDKSANFLHEISVKRMFVVSSGHLCKERG